MHHLSKPAGWNSYSGLNLAAIFRYLSQQHLQSDFRLISNSAEGKRPRKRSRRCESAVIPQFGGMFPRKKTPACFVVAVSVRAGDPSAASRRSNHRSEKRVVFSERAGLLDSGRFFRTDLGENQMVQLQASQAKQDLSAQSKSRNIYK